jgi:hypothetical protein
VLANRFNAHSALASLGLATTLVFWLALKAPHFPVLFMGSMSIGFFLLLALYYWILGCDPRLLRGWRRWTA